MGEEIKKKPTFYYPLLLTIIIASILYIYKERDILWMGVRYGLLWCQFDEAYYVKQYPEVKKSHLTPFAHFWHEGIMEEKSPNKTFNIRQYKWHFLNPRRKVILPTPIAHEIAEIKYLLTHTLVVREAEPLKSPQYYIALVTVFRNDARFLKEWIEFYRLLGVEHFYLYNHLSTDNYQEVLEPYIKAGIVELHNYKHEINSIEEFHTMQCTVFMDTARQVADKVEWLLAVDTDEFLFPTKDNDLKALLKKYDRYASLAVNQRMFGTSSVKRIPPQKLLIESLKFTADHRGPLISDGGLNLDFIKTIVKPRYIHTFGSPHFPFLKNGYWQVTENFETFAGHYAPTNTVNRVRINHYWSRDYDFFESTKLKRAHFKKKMKGVTAPISDCIKFDKDCSSVYDYAIARFVAPLHARMFP